MTILPGTVVTKIKFDVFVFKCPENELGRLKEVSVNYGDTKKGMRKLSKVLLYGELQKCME